MPGGQEGRASVTGAVAADHAEATPRPKGPGWPGIRVLLHYLNQERGRLVGIAALTAASTAVSLLVPLPLKLLVDQVLGHHRLPPPVSALPGARSSSVLLWYIVGAGLLIAVLQSLLEAAAALQWTRVGRRSVYRLSTDVYAALQRRSLQFHQQHPVGDSIMRVTDDCWAVYNLVDSMVGSPLQATLFTVASAVVMFNIDPTLAAMTLGAAPVVALSSTLLRGRTHRASEHRRQALGRLQSHVHQVLTGRSVVVAFDQHDREQAGYRRLSAEAVRAIGRVVLASNAATLVPGAAVAAAGGVVLWGGAQGVLHGQLSVGDLLVFMSYSASLQVSMRTFSELYAHLQGLRGQTRRVMEVLSGQPEVVERPDATTLGRARGEVRFEAVSFAYEPGRPVLESVSLRLPAGARVAVVGPTGAGKSTLASLLLRTFDPQAGRVLLDGVDLRDLTLSSLRAQVALVAQESYLFPVSMAENIAYGRPDASMAEIVAAAQAAGADRFIRRLPEDYQSVVGERGATLSGGERQRIAIARALLKDAPVLVLDEPTSALDTRTEAEVLDALEQLMAGRTTLLIAHRLSAVRRADLVVVLDQGRVAQVGSHDELLGSPGPYRELWRAQSGGFLPEPSLTGGTEGDRGQGREAIPAPPLPMANSRLLPAAGPGHGQEEGP